MRTSGGRDSVAPCHCSAPPFASIQMEADARTTSPNWPLPIGASTHASTITKRKSNSDIALAHTPAITPATDLGHSVAAGVFTRANSLRTRARRFRLDARREFNGTMLSGSTALSCQLLAELLHDLAHELRGF